MIDGAHIIIYSKDAEADKAFLKNVLKFKYVDVHKGWLIFKLPPSEVAVHPSDENDHGLIALGLWLRGLLKNSSWGFFGTGGKGKIKKEGELTPFWAPPARRDW